MLFKNASIYELNDFNLSIADIEEKISSKRFTPLSETGVKSTGFEHVLFNDNEKVTHVVNDCLFLQYIDATRSVPRDQLNALKDRRIADLEDKGTKITNQLRDDVETTAHAELLRLQPVKHHRSNFYIDIKRQLLVIDEKADGKCEDVIGGIRKALGSFSCLPIRLGAKPCDYANDWVSLPKDDHRFVMPEWLYIDYNGTIKGRGETAKQTVVSKGNAIDFSVFDSLSLVECDMDKCQLINENELKDEVSFTLISLPESKTQRNVDMKLVKLCFHSDAEPEGNDDIAYHNADFFLMTEELGRLIEDLSLVFGGRSGLLDSDSFPQKLDNSDGNIIWASDIQKAASKGLPDGMTVTVSVKESENTDSLLTKVQDWVAETRRASVSGVQRKFKIGYSRASQILEDLEKMGVVSDYKSNGTREVLIAPKEAE